MFSASPKNAGGCQAECDRAVYNMDVQFRLLGAEALKTAQELLGFKGGIVALSGKVTDHGIPGGSGQNPPTFYHGWKSVESYIGLPHKKPNESLHHYTSANKIVAGLPAPGRFFDTFFSFFSSSTTKLFKRHAFVLNRVYLFQIHNIIFYTSITHKNQHLLYTTTYLSYSQNLVKAPLPFHDPPFI